MHEQFRKFAAKTAGTLGSSWAFLCAASVVAVWAVVGPVYHYSAMWQLVVNTGTSVVTFLMVFLIQNTQNRDMRTIHLKLDELLRAVHEARTELVSLEERPDSELLELKEEFQKLQVSESNALEAIARLEDPSETPGSHRSEPHQTELDQKPTSVYERPEFAGLGKVMNTVL